MFKKIFFLLTIATLASCGSSKSKVATTKKAAYKPKREVAARKTHTGRTVSTTKSGAGSGRTTEVIESTSKTIVYSDVVNSYVLQYKDIAKGNMKQYGIPASIILAQGILESGAGSGTLSKTANNHFGIKCHTGWTGESVRHDDDAEQECFRKYNDPAESYRDHAEFLTGRSRYASLFKLEKGDYQGWAKGLKAAGYATDPKYPDKLISYIERYNLHQYDAEVLGVEFTPIQKSQPVAVNTRPGNTEGFYEVTKGDTLYSISKKFNTTVDDLKRLNNLSDNAISIGQFIKVK
ncbi:MAG: LysM peptidoglycan-binding domain-containing protein [Flavobacteriaceae bacterium]|uniref:glucosaminidase domain-containing protein n=1 Tax=Flavobacterium sp. Leaf359 TaxID=1736351 RepID=UPI000700EBAF|nr:glucosaminidase domain-containing protein [Flavobacterium sp. Leaf359]KQS47211.1 hemagglutinin [Flavobacterium sp. Leaf359]PZO23286.1 MAG: LysM peptidoglycan-binding domain-containing protein [Flavobacteriaceae bacterium]PZQ86314.1 MAG: LysM peptidoglycan-binding domain-containing protein [Flavobacterium johnsoniae]